LDLTVAPILAGKGLKDAFRKEAIPHLDSIYRMAVRTVSDPVLAQDLTQETFKDVWDSFHRYRLGSNCKAWLFTIFFRISNRHRFIKSRLDSIALDDVPERVLSVVPRIEEQLEQKLVLDVLSGLPAHYRTVLVLADVEGLSYKEIGTALQLPTGTVMSRLNRARALLREKYASRTDRSQTA